MNEERLKEKEPLENRGVGGGKIVSRARKKRRGIQSVKVVVLEGPAVRHLDIEI